MTDQRADSISAATTPDAEAVEGECYRCGYSLRGIADDQPCPECGLLAIRSRRTSDELHNTRPRWLRRISLGANLILLALLMTAAWPFLIPVIAEYIEPRLSSRLISGAYETYYRMMTLLPLSGFALAGLVLLLGVFLLTAREGYPPADTADRRGRRLLRLSALAALIALGLIYLHAELGLRGRPWLYGVEDEWGTMLIAALALLAAALISLPFLLFRQLRRLATRARSAHLAEHCTIVGIGTSISLLYILGLMLFFENAEALGLGINWTNSSTTSLYLVLVASVAGVLFPLWGLYLFIRFAIAFRRAAKQLRSHWSRDDRAVPMINAPA